MKYEGWTCGGAIVSPEYIVTAAACVEDVQHLYAIAGYNKLVTPEDIDEDACTRKTKKKVVLTCVPKAYELQYHKLEKWATMDIAVVKVESPFDFENNAVECSYVPAPIPINYEPHFQTPGTDAIMLGWGHRGKWRADTDLKSYNSDNLRYATTRIIDKEQCKNHYANGTLNTVNTDIFKIIDKYMICTDGTGNIDEYGNIVRRRPTALAEGCNHDVLRLMGDQGVNCEKDPTVYSAIPDQNGDEQQWEDTEDIRLNDKGEIIFNEKENKYIARNRRSQTRKNGICQNDHGGPLVTWVGSHEELIGVASVFKITKDLACVGPYLFTSTQCNGKFLDCIINDGNETRRRCDGPDSELDFDIVNRRISWIDHPDGPAENEIFDRQQIPLYNYRGDGKK